MTYSYAELPLRDDYTHENGSIFGKLPKKFVADFSIINEHF